MKKYLLIFLAYIAELTIGIPGIYPLKEPKTPKHWMMHWVRIAIVGVFLIAAAGIVVLLITLYQ